MDDFLKPPKPLTEQVQILKGRGLIICDDKKAEDFLYCINYYRFSAYCLPFEESRHKFKTGTNFEQIKNIYDLDTKLRFSLNKALEIIENAFRTRSAYFFSHKYGAFFHENAMSFYESSKFNHAEWIQKVHEETMRSKETFIEHYKNKYNGFPRMPLWEVVEVMSFGSLSLMYNNLKKQDKIDFAQNIGNFNANIFASWIHTFLYI